MKRVSFLTKNYSSFFLVALLFLNGCGAPEGYTRETKTSGGATIRNTEYKVASEPIINAFKFLKNFTRITESQREGYGVINQKYYQGGKYTLSIEYSGVFFVLHAAERALDKDRMEKHLEKVGRAYLTKDLKTYRSGDTYALYAQSGNCAVIRFATKVKDALFDNDQGNPDLLGLYSGCRGLTVSPIEFLRSLALASPGDEALYATLRNSNSTIASKGPAKITRNQEPIIPAKLTREQEKKGAVVKATDIQGLCFMAVEGSGASLRWSSKNSNFASEARRRGMTLSNCAALLNRPGPPVNSEQRDNKNAEWEKRPIAAQWTGISDLIAGELHVQQGKLKGRIKLTLPKTQSKCNGTYAMIEQRKGAWSIACTNGMTASGTLVAFGSGKGSSGEGQDNKGRSVRFTVGGL